MQSMQDDGEPDRVGAQADGAETNSVHEGADHLSEYDHGIAIEQVADVYQSERAMTR